MLVGHVIGNAGSADPPQLPLIEATTLEGQVLWRAEVDAPYVSERFAWGERTLFCSGNDDEAPSMLFCFSREGKLLWQESTNIRPRDLQLRWQVIGNRLPYVRHDAASGLSYIGMWELTP
jgi:hypothetical protein